MICSICNSDIGDVCDHCIQLLQAVVADVAATPLEGEPCADAVDGIQRWYDREHTYERLSDLVRKARALLHLPETT